MVEILEYDTPWRQLNLASDMKGSLEKFKPSNQEAKHLRFLLFGPAGAGKSSLINSINSIFRGHIFMNAIAGSSTGDRARSLTKTSKTYTIQDQNGKELPFLFTDTMGLEISNDEVKTAAIIQILEGHLSEGHKSDRAPEEDNDNKPTLKSQAHCLVIVIPADKILTSYNYSDPISNKIDEVRQVATKHGIPQVVFLTHVDTCCPLVEKDLTKVYSSKKIKQAMQHCSNKLGVPMNCIFPVKNYHEETALDEEINCLMLNALQHTVSIANDYVRDI